MRETVETEQWKKGRKSQISRSHYKKRGRPSKDQVPSHSSFHVQAQLQLNLEVLQADRTQADRFIVATNMLDDQNWSNEKVVAEDKDQTCERGFRFLKDPLFFVSRFFLKSQKRIMVLMMVSKILFALLDNLPNVGLNQSICFYIRNKADILESICGFKPLRSSRLSQPSLIKSARSKVAEEVS